MSEKEFPDSGFYSLWPTTLLRRELPGHADANLHLLSLILRLAQQHKGAFTTDYSDQELFALSDPAIDWLKTCVNRTVIDYLQHQGVNYSVDWSLQAWANINNKGDYHNLHNHPHSYLSGTYYVAVPEQNLESDQRQDLNPGAISFFDPRPQANMKAIAGDGQIEAEHRIDPVPGMILLWPSFIHHLVHPNVSEDPRVSISFNVLLKWNDAFVPLAH